MVKRIVAIAFIFVCASVAWAILGTTIFSRTYDLNQVSVNKVESLVGHRAKPITAASYLSASQHQRSREPREQQSHQA